MSQAKPNKAACFFYCIDILGRFMAVGPMALPLAEETTVVTPAELAEKAAAAAAWASSSWR